MRLTQAARQPSPAWRAALRARLSHLPARIRSLALRRRDA